MEFSNLDSREVLLEPELVGRFGKALEQVLRTLANHASIREPAQQYQVLVRLSAIEPGSIKIGFKTLVEKLTPEGVEPREGLAMLADSSQILSVIYPMMVAIAITIGVFAPDSPSIRGKAVDIEIPPEALRDPTVVEGLEEILAAAQRAGVDKVTIIIPDEPECVVVESDDSERVIFDSLARSPSGVPMGPVLGELMMSSEEILVEHGGERGVLFPGELELENGTTLRVLVGWPDMPNVTYIMRHGPFLVEGVLVPFDRTIVPVGRVKSAHRRMDALLIVKRQLAGPSEDRRSLGKATRKQHTSKKSQNSEGSNGL
jgi:hypothetical protein